MSDSSDEAASSRTSAAISHSIVRLMRDYTGRGPTKARTLVSGDLVVVTLHEPLLKAERSLVESGNVESVLEIRKHFQETMRDDLVAVVEAHTGRKVVAFMSDNHIDPDLAAELFYLEGAEAGATEASPE